MLLGALEGGGTKMVCAVGNERGEILDRVEFPTITPDVTIPQITEYFREKEVCALGIASFGPVDLNKRSKTYGYITSTTKESWKNCDFLGTIKRELKIPCGFDTDVNGAALGEATYGCMKNLQNGIYITIGTGVGVGVLSNGALVHGMLHPEGGHVLVRRHPDDNYPGICSYHGDCLEGLASGPAIKARTGLAGNELPVDSPIWDYVSYYIAQAICNYILILSPQKVVLGGGVMKQVQLIPKIRREVVRLLNGYILTPELKAVEKYIVPASLNDNQAVLGGLKLAYDAAIIS